MWSRPVVDSRPDFCLCCHLGCPRTNMLPRFQPRSVPARFSEAADGKGKPMRNALSTLTLIATLSILHNLSFGQGYILVNNNNPAGNGVTAFKVSASGSMRLFKSLTTGGTGLGGGLVGLPGIAIENNAHCFF